MQQEQSFDLAGKSVFIALPAYDFKVWIDPTITLGHMGVQEYVGNYGDDILYPLVVPTQKEAA